MDQKSIVPIIVVVVVLVIGGYVLYSNQQQSQPAAMAPYERIEPLKQDARQVAQSIEKEQQKVAAELKQVQQQAQTKNNGLQAKIKDLLAKAKKYLQDGNFDQALKIAQQVLTQFDPGSSEAKSIVQQAKDGLQKIAMQKMSEDPQKAVQGAIGGLLGQ